MDVMNPAPCRVHSRKGNPSMPDRRVVFTFDEASFTLLQQMTQELDFGSPAVTIREALRIVRAIQKQATEGYTEVVVENPVTLDQRRLVIEFLENIKSAPRE